MNANHPHDGDKVIDHTRLQLSALIDGELSPDEAAFLMRRLQHDDELAGCWERWQLAGELLRGRGGARVPAGFTAKVMAAVAASPAVAPSAGHRRRWLHWGGGAMAASMALVALLVSRPAGPPSTTPKPSNAVATTTPAVVAPAGRRPTPTPRPALPDTAARLASAVAVADVPRRVGGARRGNGQAQRALSRAHGRGTPSTAIATAADIAMSAKVAANPFSPQPALPPSRPWPRSLVPGMPANGAFTVDYAGGQAQSPSFYPFEPHRFQPQRERVEAAPSDTP